MKLSTLILEYKPGFEVHRINIGYTDFGRYYGTYLYEKPTEGGLNNWKDKIRSYDEAAEYIKNLTGMELPRDYAPATLDKITDALKAKGIDADHDDVMDVS